MKISVRVLHRYSHFIILQYTKDIQYSNHNLEILKNNSLRANSQDSIANLQGITNKISQYLIQVESL